MVYDLTVIAYIVRVASMYSAIRAVFQASAVAAI